MPKQLLSQSALLGLSLGMLLLAATVPAHAEPTSAPNEPQKEASAASADAAAEVPEKASEMKVRTVILAEDVEETKHRGNRRLMLTSTALFATGYVPALVTVLANSKGTSGWLGVPVVGPWVDWGPNTSAGNKTLLFASGVFQAVGLAGFVSSFFLPESKTKKVPLMGKRRINVAPVAGRGTYSISATGTF